MNKQVQEIRTDVLRTAYNQVKELADTIDKTLRKTIEQLCDEQGTLTDEQGTLLGRTFYWILTSRRELNKTFDALWEWQYYLYNPQDRLELPDKVHKDLDESDKTSNTNQ